MTQWENRHAPYYVLGKYQSLLEFSDAFLADQLSCSAEQFRNKRDGVNDFSQLEAGRLSEIFGMSEDELFKTEDD